MLACGWTLDTHSGLAKACVIAKVNGTPWDLTRVLEEDCTVELIKFSDPEGRDTFWHSSAHILGQVSENHIFCVVVCPSPRSMSRMSFQHHLRLVPRRHV